MSSVVRMGIFRRRFKLEWAMEKRIAETIFGKSCRCRPACVDWRIHHPFSWPPAAGLNISSTFPCKKTQQAQSKFLPRRYRSDSGSRHAEVYLILPAACCFRESSERPLNQQHPSTGMAPMAPTSCIFIPSRRLPAAQSVIALRTDTLAPGRGERGSAYLSLPSLNRASYSFCARPPHSSVCALRSRTSRRSASWEARPETSCARGSSTRWRYGRQLVQVASRRCKAADCILRTLDSSAVSPYAVAHADFRLSAPDGPPAFHEIPDSARYREEVRIEMRLKSPATGE